MDKPSIEDILAKRERWHRLSIGEQNDAWDYYMAMLAATMRENERLREVLAKRPLPFGQAVADFVNANEHTEGKTFDYHTTDGRPCKITVPPGHDGEIVDGVLRVTPNKHSEELDPSVMPPRNPPD